MKPRHLLLTLILSLPIFIPVLLFSQADGKWLRRVPDEDRARTNPLAGQAPAAAAGKML